MFVKCYKLLTKWVLNIPSLFSLIDLAKLMIQIGFYHLFSYPLTDVRMYQCLLWYYFNYGNFPLFASYSKFPSLGVLKMLKCSISFIYLKNVSKNCQVTRIYK